MNTHISAVKKAAAQLNLKVNAIDKDELFIEVTDGKKSEYFIQQVPPLNTVIVKRICKDKEYTYELLKNVVKMPKTKGYLDPKIQENYFKYVHFKSSKDLVLDIEKNFSYPIIVKRNSGSQGRNVFLCKNNSEAKKAIHKIFQKEYLNYDYSLIAQEKINIKQEFRVLILNTKVELVYLKDNSGADFEGNLSPLHWKDSKAVIMRDQDLISRLQNFINPIFTKLNLQYGGLDIAIDHEDEMWLIEANSHPFFEYFIKDNGDAEIVKLYEKMLRSLFRLV